MSEQIPQATPEQIQAFKQGAAQRYQERGLTPAQAEQLFQSYMGKLAEEAGLVPQVDTAKCEKIAEALKAKLQQKPVKTSVKK